MSADVTQYTDLITSEHISKPNFVAMVGQTCQAWADLTQLLNSIPGLYDLVNAVGAQLDVVGQWVGVTRKLEEPLTGVYFSLDVAGLGLDQGVLQGPYDPTSGLVSLPDAQYLLLISAKILNNQWDGSVPGAYTLLNTLFNPLGYQIAIEDHANLTMGLALLTLTSALPDVLVTAMFTNGLLDVKPVGVRITTYDYQTQLGPLFALDVENSLFAGLDVGAFGLSVLN
jgi:hypothetical protein